jgi:hypothetical protein
MVPTREQILGNKRAAKMVPVDVPFWGGGRVYIRELTGKEQDAFEATLAAEYEKAKKGGKEYTPNVRGQIVVACVCNEDGKCILEPDDADVVGNMPAWQLESIVDNADQLNRFTSKYKESLEKKYATRGASASVAGSPTDGDATPSTSTSNSPAKSSKDSKRTGQ